MRRRKSVAYDRQLSRPSMPVYPAWPSLNDLRKWSKARREAEQRGIKLLMEYYTSRQRSLADCRAVRSLMERRSVVSPSLESEVEQLKALLLALATNHVPFFKTKSRKRATWNNHVLARLLYNYQAAIRHGRSPKAARSATKKDLPEKLKRAADKTIENRLAEARVLFSKVVRITANGSLEPLNERAAWAWRFHLADPNSAELRATLEPNPADPNGILVLGLPE